MMKKVRNVNKTPFDYSVIEYAAVVMMSAWGGTVALIARISRGERVTLWRWALEIAASGFVGVLMFWAGELAELHPLATAFSVGVAGYANSKLLPLLEKMMIRRVSNERNEKS